MDLSLSNLKINETPRNKLDLLPPVLLEEIIGKIKDSKDHHRLLAVNKTIANTTGILLFILRNNSSL